MRGVLGVVVVAVAVAVLPAIPGTAAEPTCDTSSMPYAGIPGAQLVATEHTSRDDPPVRYVLWRGVVPGFDGLPFSVDVTVPCDGARPRPLVAMAHGFGDDKTVWEETGKSDRVASEGRPQTNTRWNNIWFASRGYAVLTYTARGWHDSCGPAVPGAVPGVAPAPHCLDFEYWIHLDDKRWEVRDLQWLTGGLVQTGVAHPDRLAVTGGSYGGGPASMGALLGGRTMCGAAATPVALGPDPCAGRSDGELVPWTTPDGATPLRWRASVPLYTFADLIQVLAPNGRGSDGGTGAPPDGDPTDPFGVPIQSTVAGLLAAGQAAGYFAPPGVDPDADIFTDAARLLAGNPFPQDDPLVARGVRLYREFKSPITSDPDPRAPVPIFWVQGFTDPLFTGLEALQMVHRLRGIDPRYPIKVFLGDLGHDYTGQRQDEWDLVREQMNAFLDHHLGRGGPAPTYDVGATVTRCLDQDAPMRYVAAPSWSDLHPESVTFTSTEPAATSSAVPGPAALATDPISTATLPLPGSYKGCRRMAPSSADPTAATYTWATVEDVVLLGGPVVDVGFTTTAPDTELNVRLWDVAPDGSVQGLVTRGTYRSLDGPGAGLRARFQIAPNGYRFPAGHTVKLEVAANDFPYHQASNVPAEVVVEEIALTLPLLERGGGGGETTAAPRRPAPTLPATGGTSDQPIPWAVALGLLATGLAARRLLRRAA